MPLIPSISFRSILNPNLGCDDQAWVGHSIVNQPDQLWRMGKRVDRSDIHAECLAKVVAKRKGEVARVQTAQGPARRVRAGDVQSQYAETTLPPSHPDGKMSAYIRYSREGSVAAFEVPFVGMGTRE